MPNIPDTPQRSAAQLADSIAGLTVELNELKRRKRSFNSEMNEQIKDLEEQIAGEEQQWQMMKAREGSEPA